MMAEISAIPECYRKFLLASERTGLLDPTKLVSLRPWMVQQATALWQMLESRVLEAQGGAMETDLPRQSPDQDGNESGAGEQVVRQVDRVHKESAPSQWTIARGLALSPEQSAKFEENFQTLCENRLIEKMQQAGWLNRWQTRQLLQGRTRFSLGSYRIVDFIGRGGMGNVFKGIHHLIGHEVAIKILPKEKMTPRSIGRFQAEVHTLSSLSHPHLVRAFDAGFEGKVHYLVTEYVPGMDLRKWVLTDGILDMSTAASIIIQVASALDYAHHCGIIHRDVKPANILVTPEGVAKLSDLGLVGFQDSISSASLLPDEQEPASGLDFRSSAGGVESGSEEDEPPTDPDTSVPSVPLAPIPRKPTGLPRRVVGTRDYLPPDAIREPKHPTPLWDIYSLGCTLYFAVTGQVPFPNLEPMQKLYAHLHLNPVDPRKLNPELSEPFVERLGSMIRKVPQHRCESARRVIEMFSPWNENKVD